MSTDTLHAIREMLNELEVLIDTAKNVCGDLIGRTNECDYQAHAVEVVLGVAEQRIEEISLLLQVVPAELV